MSYLEMASSSLPDMSSGIISLWFRDAKKAAAPNADIWPSGSWQPGTTSMVPPWTQEIVKTLTPPSIFFWDSYGLPIGLFQGFLTGPAIVWIPSPPPFATDTIHMVLSFGDPNQPYNYCPWSMETPPVIAAVNYTPAAPGVGFQPDDWPPPYKPYYLNQGDNGKFIVRNMRLQSAQVRSGMVPQSFIGIDKDGYVVINLQTNTRATYTGYAFELNNISEMEISATHFVVDGPPYTYTQIGFPFPDGHFEETIGYWNGYQFEYSDISNEVMSGQAESFFIGGPPVFGDFIGGPRVDLVGNTWHHLLFSFDITGAVQVAQTADAQKPDVATACKAWLALDDRNYTGAQLQRRMQVPDGITLPLLPGMGHDILFGKVTSHVRSGMSLRPNDILPRNAWLAGVAGYPRDGMLRYVSSTGISTGMPGNAHYPAGDFNGLEWSANLWTLYWPLAPGPAFATANPPHPTVPDPKTFDSPIYSCDSFKLPVHGFPIGVPAGRRHLDHNTGVEMAELQIWANSTLDTSDIKMRRLFIDEDGKPVLPSAAEKVLGKPDVRLNGSSAWIKGSNTGTSGVDGQNQIIPAGQFEPVSKIRKFLPDPQLGK